MSKRRHLIHPLDSLRARATVQMRADEEREAPSAAVRARARANARLCFRLQFLLPIDGGGLARKLLVAFYSFFLKRM